MVWYDMIWYDMIYDEEYGGSKCEAIKKAKLCEHRNKQLMQSQPMVASFPEAHLFLFASDAWPMCKLSLQWVNCWLIDANCWLIDVDWC